MKMAPVLAFVLLPLVAGSAVAAPACATPSGAIAWWFDQEERAVASPAAVHHFWSSWLGRLQLTEAEGAPALCAFLEDILAASEGGAEAPDRLLAAAHTAASMPDPELGSPALLVVGKSIGADLENQTKRIEVTSGRIRALERAAEVYAASGSAGALVRVERWLEAERKTFDADRQRVTDDLDAADALVRRSTGGIAGVLRLAAVPGLLERLDVDKRLMEHHGAEPPEGDRLAEIESASAALRAHQASARAAALVTTFLVLGAAAGLMALVAVPFRAYERDVDDVEVALKAVPA